MRFLLTKLGHNPYMPVHFQTWASTKQRLICCYKSALKSRPPHKPRAVTYKSEMHTLRSEIP
ncbi:hypothetical protein EMGBS1_05800 [Chloroflexota bacterium]|nr:hypothetical protein EMGBS1_05800 [Chloroflexota bacterium]